MPIVKLPPSSSPTERPFRVAGRGAVTVRKGAGRFRGQFMLLRKDFGVSFDPPINPIENEVQVQWDFSIKEPAQTPSK